jgi:DNA-binding GntR family transcriptional regulator
VTATHGSKSSAHEIFEELSFRITHLMVPMGERLTEQGLSREFGVSRTPVREALRLLEQAGHVEKSSGRSYAVRAMSLERVDRIYTVRVALEVLSVELAARAIRTDEFAALKTDVIASVQSARSTEGDGATPGKTGELREGFHERLAALSGNEELVRMLRDIDAQIFAFRRLDSAVPQRARQAQEEHLEILELLEEKRVEAACETMREHIEKSQSTVRSLIRAGVTTISFGPPGQSTEK